MKLMLLALALLSACGDGKDGWYVEPIFDVTVRVGVDARDAVRNLPAIGTCSGDGGQP